MIDYEPLRAIIVGIQLPTDHTGDLEFPLIVQKFPRVALRLQKMQSSGFIGCDEKSYNSLKNSIADTLSTLKPNEIITSAGLACTSMSFSLGLDEVNNIIKNSLPLSNSTNMGSSILKALNTFKIKNILIINPYIKSLSDVVVKNFTNSGFNVLGCYNFGLHSDLEIEQVSPNYVFEKALEMVNKLDNKLEAVVISCSGLRVCGNNFIDKLEKETGKLVITSSQAFIWDLVRLSNIDDRIDGFGRLFIEY